MTKLRVTGRLGVCFFLLLFAFPCGADAAVTPISVGPSGVGPIAFDALPTPADGWATAAWAGANVLITNGSQMDAAANTNSAGAITNALRTDTTATNETTMFGSHAVTSLWRWNNGSADHFLESRPDGISYAVLLGAFVNRTEFDISSFVLSYDYALDLASGASIAEELPGFRVYYSLTGEPGSWRHIPEFDGTNAGRRVAAINACRSNSSWAVGQNLYVLWCDDNAMTGELDNGGIVEGPNALDNVQISFENCVAPTITTQPRAVWVENCRGTNLVVSADSCAGFQWFKDGSAVIGATSAIYEIPNATGVDIGTYWVRVVTGCGGTVESEHVSVVVQESDPMVLSALVHGDRTTVVLNFPHRMASMTAQEAGLYAMRAVDGGADQTVQAAVLSSNGTVVTLTLAEPITASKNYELLIEPTVSDCAGNLLAPTSDDGYVHVALQYEVSLLSFEGTSWKYNHEGVDLGTAWRLNPHYDDRSWSNGVSVFDGKAIPRNQVSGFPVMTQLPLMVPQFQDGVSNVPVFYFRTHFLLPVIPSQITSLSLCTLVDDFDAMWLNGYDRSLHTRPGLPVDENYYGYSGGVDIGTFMQGPFSIDPTNLVHGENFVAAKVFQLTASSGDITFAYELVAVAKAFPPRISISFDGANVHITWPGSSMNLYEATAPDAPANDWRRVDGQVAGSATIMGVGGQPPGAAKFYSLRE